MVSKMKSKIALVAAFFAVMMCCIGVGALGGASPAYAEEYQGDIGNGCSVFIGNNCIVISDNPAASSPSFSMAELKALAEKQGEWDNLQTFMVNSKRRITVTDERLQEFFAGNSSVEYVDLSKLDFPSTIAMDFMFERCGSLRLVSMEGCDTHNVTSMAYMFQGTPSLNEIYLTGIDTSKVEYMTSMFGYSGATELDLTSFNTSNISNAQYMFAYSRNLQTIVASNEFVFNADSAVDYMFDGCSNLRGEAGTTYSEDYTGADAACIDRNVDGTWGTDKGYFTGGYAVRAKIPNGKIFSPYSVRYNQDYHTLVEAYKDYAIPEELTIKVGNTTLEKDTDYTYQYGSISIPASKINGNISISGECKKAPIAFGSGCLLMIGDDNSLTISSDKDYSSPSFSMAELKQAVNERCGWSNITSLTVNSDKTIKVTDSSMEELFTPCNELRTVDLRGLDFSSADSMSRMFYESSVEEVNLSGVNTSGVTDMSEMFRDAQYLTKIDMSNIDTSNVEYMMLMFSGCVALEDLNMGNWNTSNAQMMSSMFEYCIQLQTLDLTTFNTANVTDMSFMFNSDYSLQTIYVTDRFMTDKVEYSYEMFTDCSKLEGSAGTTYNSSHTDCEAARIDKAKDDWIGSNAGYFTGAYRVNTDVAGGSSSGHAYSPYGSDYTTTITANEYWLLPTTITVKIGETVLDTEAYSYDSTTGEIMIPANVITDDIAIAAGCTEGILFGNGCIVYIGSDNSILLDTVDGVENPSFVPGTSSSGVGQKNELTDIVNTRCGWGNITSFSVANGKTIKMDGGGALFAFFLSCKRLETANLQGLDISAGPGSLQLTFMNCSSLTSVAFPITDSALTFKGATQQAFTGCSSLTTIDLTDFDTADVERMNSMFKNCSNLKTIYVSKHFTTDALTDNGANMFTGCNNLVGKYGTEYDSGHIDKSGACRDQADGTTWGTDKGYFTGANRVLNKTENGTFDGGNLVIDDDNYTATVTPDEGYVLPRSISVYAGPDLIDPTTYDYNSETGVIVLPASVITDRINIIAECETPKFDVIFNTQGHGNAPETQRVDPDGYAQRPDDPSETGWTFVDWYKESDCQNLWNFATDKVTENTELFAKWNVNQYQVTFNNGGHGTTPEPQTVNYGDKVRDPGTLTETGWTFAGWYKDAGFQQVWNFNEDTVSNATTIYAKWEINKYQVTFNIQGHGSQPEPQTVNYGDKVSDPGQLSETGWTFGGWYKDADCQTPWVFNDDVVSDTTIIYAKWDVNQYQVTFNNGGHGSAPEPQTISYGGKVDNPGALSETGWTFVDWYKDAGFQQVWNFDEDTITGPTTIYAKWTINQYTVTFNNGGHGNTPEPQTVNYGGKVDNPGELSEEGWTFDGWFKGADFQTEWNFRDDTISGPTTIYAKWTQDTCEVTFADGFGGILKTETVNYGEAATAPADPTHAGYKFAGWDKAFDHIIEPTTITALWKGDIESVIISDIDRQKWNGKPIKPAFTVTAGEKTLTEGVDYTVEYANNMEPGTATITITGINDFAGTKTVNFQIGETLYFKDVYDSTPHNAHINWLAAAGISTGWLRSDGRYFEPASYVLRADMAAFLYRTAGFPEFDETKAENPFNDVTPETPHYKEVLWCYATGITTGYGTGTDMRFEPFTPVYRQDMAAFLHRTEKVIRDGNDKQGAITLTFEDVTEATPHYTDIEWLAKSGITTGYHIGDKDYYKPMELVYRQDMAAFLHRLSDFSRYDDI